MRKNFSVLLVFALLCTLPSLAEQKIQGYTGLYMGHSFFRPCVEHLEKIIPETEVAGHTQHQVTAGGPNGSPGMLWENEKKRADGQQILDTGKIDLLVMTYYSPENSSLEHYSRWIDYAIDRNPDTTFMLALPWGRHLFKATEKQIEADRKWSLELNNTLVKELREKYPKNNILYCPYGLGTYELIERFHEGKLPGVKTLLDPDKKTREQTQLRKEQLFRDALGHPGALIAKTGTLLWIQTLYGIDPSTLPPQRVDGLPDIDVNEIAATVGKVIKPLNAASRGK
jgi:hypothetical protein